MPAYFSINFEFKQTETDALVRRFFAFLEKEGVHFLRGFWKGEGFSYEQIINANQNYLNGKSRNDGSFCQVQFRFMDFSEVRGYWDVDESSIRFNLIIPEDDFLDITERKARRIEENMAAARDLCIRLWKMPAIVAIQTAWECSDVPPRFAEICDGVDPQAEPFSIVPLEVYQLCHTSGRRIARNGALIENNDNWF